MRQSVARLFWGEVLLICTGAISQIYTIHFCQSFRHIFCMTVRTSIIFALALGLCLAVTSVVSATLMAPDAASNARAVHQMVFGVTSADFCGDDAGHQGHDHNCPFCHALAQPPQLTTPDLYLVFRPHELWRQGEALRRAAQARNINHSTRAPPQGA